MSSSPINSAFLRFRKRAESEEPAHLVETFVDVGALIPLLSSQDHQIVYGRRGTGKTHALIYLKEKATERGDLPVYVDMRQIGSTGGIYSDLSLTIGERATRLLMDTLAIVHEKILELVVLRSDELNLAVVGPRLDRLAEAITEVKVTGETEVQRTQSSAASSSTNTKAEVSLSASPRASMAGSSGARNESATELKVRQAGTIRHRVHFGTAGAALTELLESLGGHRVWVLLDEWSAVPNDLQPLLADLVRRTLLPVRAVTVKIAAIEQRSTFQSIMGKGDYVGIEVGADASADVNLDDFMVFENSVDRAVAFFQQLVYRHFRRAVEETAGAEQIESAEELVRQAFTQKPAFEEFVRASEGVPRDAINIIALAAQRADADPISINHIRHAAKSWYQRDKESAVGANASAREMLSWIIDDVIAHRKARAFLLKANTRHGLIDALFDARVLHVLKRSIAAHDEPGVRYDVYKIDYGCYVDLLSTARAPQGLLPSGMSADDAAEFVDVPPDDYRAIRRAILDVGQFRPKDDARA